MIGLLVSWKWKIVGGLIGIVAFLIMAILNPRILTIVFPEPQTSEFAVDAVSRQVTGVGAQIQDAWPNPFSLAGRSFLLDR